MSTADRPSHDPLVVVEEADHFVNFEQPEFADRWRYSASFDGCVNFGQNDPSTTDSEGRGGDVCSWEHICDIDLLIAHLVQVRDYCKAKWPRDWGSDE